MPVGVVVEPTKVVLLVRAGLAGAVMLELQMVEAVLLELPIEAVVEGVVLWQVEPQHTLAEMAVQVL